MDMRPDRFQHFLHVANNMNKYVVASTHQYYQRQYYKTLSDRMDYLNTYRIPSLLDVGLGGILAYGLNYIGMGQSVVRLAYRIGYFLDAYA